MALSMDAESSREQTHESDRKKTSVLRKMGKRIKSSDHFARSERHASVIGSNLGSNRNAENRCVTNRERVGHVTRDAQPNNVEATGVGHYEVDHDSNVKFVRE